MESSHDTQTDMELGLTEDEIRELEPELDPSDGIELEPTIDADSDAGDSELIPPDRRLITNPFDLAVLDLVNRVKEHRLELSPVYQRKYVWDNAKASKLVESLLINVPIPVCYLAEESDGGHSVIDGQQRLRSLVRYLGNEFPLRGLEVLPEINGKRFQQLSDRQQRLICNRTIRCIVISADSDPDIRFDVFERLNTGSVALNAQELRNSVYRGPLNELLRDLAVSEEWRECVGAKTNQRMVFEELSLRFLALYEGLDSYKPNLKRFLNDYMRSKRDLEPEQLAELSELVRHTLKKVHTVFGDQAFRRPIPDTSPVEWRPIINSALFDVVMQNFARLDVDQNELTERSDQIRELLVELIETNSEFDDAISLATGDKARLRTRLRLFAEGLDDLGLSSGLASQLVDE